MSSRNVIMEIEKVVEPPVTEYICIETHLSEEQRNQIHSAAKLQHGHVSQFEADKQTSFNWIKEMVHRCHQKIKLLQIEVVKVTKLISKAVSIAQNIQEATLFKGNENTKKDDPMGEDDTDMFASDVEHSPEKSNKNKESDMRPLGEEFAERQTRIRNHYTRGKGSSLFKYLIVFSFIMFMLSLVSGSIARPTHGRTASPTQLGIIDNQTLKKCSFDVKSLTMDKSSINLTVVLSYSKECNGIIHLEKNLILIFSASAPCNESIYKSLNSSLQYIIHRDCNSNDVEVTTINVTIEDLNATYKFGVGFEAIDYIPKEKILFVKDGLWNLICSGTEIIIEYQTTFYHFERAISLIAVLRTNDVANSSMESVVSNTNWNQRIGMFSSQLKLSGFFNMHTRENTTLELYKDIKEKPVFTEPVKKTNCTNNAVTSSHGLSIGLPIGLGFGIGILVGLGVSVWKKWLYFSSTEEAVPETRELQPCIMVPH